MNWTGIPKKPGSLIVTQNRSLRGERVLYIYMGIVTFMLVLLYALKESGQDISVLKYPHVGPEVIHVLILVIAIWPLVLIALALKLTEERDNNFYK